MAWFCTQLYIGKDSLSRLAGVEEENFLPSFFEVFQQFQELSVQFLDKNLFLPVRLVHWTQCEPNGVSRWILSHFNSQSKWFPATSVKYLLLGSNQKLCGCFVSGKWTLILFYHHSEREYNNQRNISIWSLDLILAELRLLLLPKIRLIIFSRLLSGLLRYSKNREFGCSFLPVVENIANFPNPPPQKT